jgi:hypothetical protein
MARRLAIAGAVLLALAGAAAAKGPVAATLCGASGCTQVSDLGPINPMWLPTALIEAPAPAPFYTLRASSPGPEGFDWSLVYVPSRRAVRFENRGPSHPAAYVTGRYWVSMSDATASSLETIAAGIEPFPASESWSPRAKAHDRSYLAWVAAVVVALAVAAWALRSARRRSAVPVTP